MRLNETQHGTFVMTDSERVYVWDENTKNFKDVTPDEPSLESPSVTSVHNCPAYKSHKVVGAHKIKDIDLVGVPGAKITPEDAGEPPFEVTEEYLIKHRPTVGGYFVVYEDGYLSFSPAEAFEDGYTKI